MVMIELQYQILFTEKTIIFTCKQAQLLNSLIVALFLHVFPCYIKPGFHIVVSDGNVSQP